MHVTTRKGQSSPSEALTADEVLRKQYECGELRFVGDDQYDRHLVFDHVVRLEDAASASGSRRWRGRSATCSPSAGC